MALFHLERYDKSLALLEVVVSRNPAFNRGHLMLAATYAYLDNLEMAQWSLDEARILSPNLSLADEQADSILLQQTALDRYLTGLKLAGLE